MLFSEAVTGSTFKCDSCKGNFLGETIKLEKAPKNITMNNPFMPFAFVDKNGVIMRGNNGPSSEKGDLIAKCPKCDHAHLFGFNKV